MKVETITDGSLRVWLSDEDLVTWGLLPQERPDCRENAKRLVRRVLHTAHVRATTRLLAELFPVEGGWVLLLSPYSRAAGGVTQGPEIYRLASADDLCALAERWCQSPAEGEAPGVVLFERAEGYDLAVCPVTPLTQAQRCLLEEYGRLVGTGMAALAAAEEYGRLLGSDVLCRLGLSV